MSYFAPRRCHGWQWWMFPLIHASLEGEQLLQYSWLIVLCSNTFCRNSFFLFAYFILPGMGKESQPSSPVTVDSSERTLQQAVPWLGQLCLLQCHAVTQVLLSHGNVSPSSELPLSIYSGKGTVTLGIAGISVWAWELTGYSWKNRVRYRLV